MVEDMESESTTKRGRPKRNISSKTINNNNSRVKLEEVTTDKKGGEPGETKPIQKQEGFCPFDILGLHKLPSIYIPAKNLFPPSGCQDYKKLQATVSGIYKDEIIKGEIDNDVKKPHLRKDIARINALAGDLSNVTCDSKNIQGQRRMENGKVEYLCNWFAKDEEICNLKHSDNIQSPSKYFENDKDTNSNSNTVNVKLLMKSMKKEVEIDLTNLDDFPDPDIFITKSIKSERKDSRRKISTPKRHQNPDLITLD